MSHLLTGIGLGLSLAILVGPLIVALLQTTLEQGFRAGLVVGAGIWISDALFVLATYFGVNYMIAITKMANFELVLGSFGGIVLFLIGLGIFINSPKELPKGSFKSSKDWLSNGIKGFLINTINPFTFFFWITVMTTSIDAEGMDQTEVAWMSAGILGTIVFTDTLKVAFAKKLQKKMTLQNIITVRKISGAALVIFGIVLIIRVLT